MALVIDPVIDPATLLTVVSDAVVTDAAGNRYEVGFSTAPQDHVVDGPPQSTFAFTFSINTAAELKVYRNGAVQTQNVHYTLNGTPPMPGGTVTFTAAATNGDVIGFVKACDGPGGPPTCANATFGGGQSDLSISKFNSSDVAQWSTFIRGTAGDVSAANSIAVVGTFVYIAGTTTSTDLATLMQAAGATLGPQSTYGDGQNDAFVMKLDATTGQPLFFTYLGGSGADSANALTTDTTETAGTTYVYVTGATSSGRLGTDTPFPVSLSASQATYGGGDSDAFVTKLQLDPIPTNVANTIVYSTYLGGSGGEAGTGIIVVSAGVVEVAGETFDPAIQVPTAFFSEPPALMMASEPGIRLWAPEAGFLLQAPDFPTTLGAHKTPRTGGPNDIADAFLTRFGATSAHISSTLLGGDGLDRAVGISKDPLNGSIVTGWTDSANFTLLDPVQSVHGGLIDSFVTKFNTPDTVAFSTYIGGNQDDLAASVAIASNGDAYVVGTTNSTEAPAPTVPPVPADGDGNPLSTEVFLTKLGAPTTQTTQAPTLGFAVSAGTAGSESGTVLGAAVDSKGNVYLAGSDGQGLALKLVNATIDVRPHSKKNNINVKSRRVRVAILSTADFDATTEIDQASLTFGRTGAEESLIRCDKKPRRVNKDKLKDLVCSFSIAKANFQAGDTLAILKGNLVGSGKVFSDDKVKIIVPCEKPKHGKGSKHDKDDKPGHCHRHGHDFDDDGDDLE